jgi:hypothetical protein
VVALSDNPTTGDPSSRYILHYLTFHFGGSRGEVDAA